MMKVNMEKMMDITKKTMTMINGKEMNRLDSVNLVDRVTVSPATQGKEEEDGTTIVCDA